jgi:CheY-like chemotaxis protein
MTSAGNILIVDDEPHVRRYLSLVVRSLGPVQVHEASDGDAALALYPTLVPPPILVLLDVNMPGIDGIETLRRLRAAGYENPAAMLTSLANRQTVEDAISAGADNYIRKDTPKDEIIAALRALLAAADEENDDASAPSA